MPPEAPLPAVPAVLRREQIKEAISEVLLGHRPSDLPLAEQLTNEIEQFVGPWMQAVLSYRQFAEGEEAGPGIVDQAPADRAPEAAGEGPFGGGHPLAGPGRRAVRRVGGGQPGTPVVEG